jgi:hypothetical protein
VAYTINLSDNPIPFKHNEANKIKFVFTIIDSTYEGTEEHTIIDFDEFEIGSNDKDEIVCFVSNMKVEFKLEQVTFEKFEQICFELRTKFNAPVHIYRNANIMFFGYVLSEDVTGKAHTRRIELTITDQMIKLKDEGMTGLNHMGHAATDMVRVKDFIKELINYAYFVDDTYITEVVSLCKIEGLIEVAGVQHTVTFDDFALHYGAYANSAPIFPKASDAIKGILQGFGCMGYCGLDGIFYIVPRKYNDSPVYVLTKKNMYDEPEMGVVNKMDHVYAHMYNKGEAETYPYGRGGISQDDKNEEIIFFYPGGSLPSGKPINDLSRLKAYYNGQLYYVIEDSFRNVKPDGTYTDRTSLWNLVGQDTWDLVGQTRREYKVKALGTYETLHFGQYYVFEDNPGRVYRLRRAKYSLKGKGAELTLIDATINPLPPREDVIFDQMMEAQGAEIEYMGERFDTLSTIKTISANLYIIVDNMYASSQLSITRYDGTVIDIPITSLDSYRTVESYPVYIAVSKTGLPPEFDYPNTADTNATWYLLTTIKDNKNHDPDYEYRQRLPRINTGGKKFYLWVGMKSTDAQLFPGIMKFIGEADALGKE